MSGENDLIFEDIKKVNEYGVEYWYARDLQKILNYAKWENFEKVIKKAISSCKISGNKVSDHLPEVRKMIKTAKGAQIEVIDYKLTRYACYLIAQNGDPRKKTIALAQTYFAIQTRRKELEDKRLKEEERLFLRREMATHNKKLASAAKDAGVSAGLEYAIFQNFGYKGLYGGMDSKAIHKKKGLKKSQKILDHMDSEEIAANLFRATQAEGRLRRENIKGRDNANKVHYDVGIKVRKTIKEIGGTMPENLPSVESVKKIERKIKKRLKNGN